MAAAVPPPQLFSALYSDRSLWETPNPSYDTLCGLFAHSGTSVAAPACRDGLAQLAVRSPTVIAFMLNSDLDSVYVAHSITLFPGDPTSATSMDGMMVGLLGDNPNSVVPIVFPQACFTCPASAAAYDITYIQGPNGHSHATAPVFRFPGVASGSADTDDLRSRPAIVMPSDVAAQAILGAPVDGRYTLLAFFNMFIQAPLLDPDATVRATIQPLATWWRLACMNAAGGAGVLSQAAHAPASPLESALLTRWVSRVRDSQMARLGHGGPGLSNASFARGVDTIRNTMENNLQDRLQYERDRALKTFSDVHGDALAQVMFRLCGCIDDSGLPPVHSLLLKTEKSRVYGMLNSLFAERAAASTVPLTTAMAPMATTTLVGEVFRSYMPGSDGLTFAKGLSPFAIVCPGHEGIAAVQQRIQQAQLIEAGSSVTLSDASALISDDVRFPSAPFVAVEKFYGWSVVVDVFLGVGHTVSINLRQAVLLVGPLLQRLASQMGDNTGAGMELICRVMFDMQQDFFVYLSKTSAGIPCAAPDFMNVVGLVSTYRADSLSALPSPWYQMLSCPRRTSAPTNPAPANAPPELRSDWWRHWDRRQCQSRPTPHEALQGQRAP